MSTPHEQPVTREELRALIESMRADRAESRADRTDLLEQMRAERIDWRGEMANAREEARADRAETRLEFAAVRREMREGFERIDSTLATVIDSIADLRNEDHNHTHG